MDKPQIFSDWLKKHQVVWLLIIGIGAGFTAAIFFYNERIENLKTLLTSKEALIAEYRERLQIRERNEGPYRFYTDRELKDRAIELSRKIENLCEENPLLLTGEFYERKYDEFKTNPDHHEADRLEAKPGSVLILPDSGQGRVAIDKLSPTIAESDIGRTYGDLAKMWMDKISESIAPQLEIYKNEYMRDAVNLIDEMLGRMPPRADRFYRFHVDPRNPGLFMIGVAIQLREIANDLIR